MRLPILLAPLLLCLACASPPVVSTSPGASTGGSSTGGGSAGGSSTGGGGVSGLSATASQVEALAPAGGALADGSEVVTLRATLVDGTGAPVAGAGVVFAASGTGNQLGSGASTTTDAEGVATAQLTSTHAEAKAITVTATPAGGEAVLLTHTAQAQFVVPALVLAGDAGPLPADGNSTARLTATLTRGPGGPAVVGRRVSWTVSGTRNALAADAATDANGQIQRALASLHGETKTVTVSLGGVNATAQVAFSTTNVCGASSLLAGLPWAATGKGTGPVTLVDADADGHLDWLQAAGDSNAVYLHPGQGNGLFAAPVSIPVPVAPTSLQVVDVSGDGHADLLVFNSVSVFTLLSDGHGSWNPPVASVLPVDGNGQAPASLGGAWPAELTGDARVDLAVTGQTADQNYFVLTLRGDGQGGFAANANLFITPYGVSAVTTADLDGDGAAEVLALGPNSASDHNVRLRTLHNDGRGAWQESAAAPSLDAAITSPIAGFALTALRLNSDAHVDVVAGAGDKVSVFLGDGQGGLTPGQVLLEPVQALSLTDMNGDGRQDVVVGVWTQASPLLMSAAHVYFNAGDGNLTVGPSYPTPYSGFSWQFGDLNEDGALDRVFSVLSSSSVGAALGLPGNPMGSSDSLYSLVSAAPASAQALASADLNGDGRPEILVQNAGPVTLLVNQSTAGQAATFSSVQPSDLPLAPGPLLLADVNQDSNQDLVVADTRQTKLYILRGTGDANFVASQQPNCTGAAKTITAADLNHDGAPDLVTTLGTAGLNVLLNAGDGNFLDGTAVSLSATPGTNAVMADVTGDSNADVLVVANANLVLLAGDGNGAFAAPVQGVSLGAVYAPGWVPTWLLAHDLTGDGNTDLVVAGSPGSNSGNGTSAAFVVLVGHGDGTFTAGTPFGSIGTGLVGQPQLVDTDGDGVLDLVMPDHVGYVAVLHGHPDGTFDPGAYYGSNVTIPQQVAVQDFDGDGLLDLAQLGLEGVQVSHGGGCVFPAVPPVERPGCAAVPVSAWALLGLGWALRRARRRAPVNSPG